jgi:ESCRT-I complex subunit MVB12
MNQELPITAICIVSELQRCPANYTPISRSYDTNTEIDLWKDGLFGKKINRYICYTKDYPIADVIIELKKLKKYFKKILLLKKKI